jgi:hypothetical protein
MSISAAVIVPLPGNDAQQIKTERLYVTPRIGLIVICIPGSLVAGCQGAIIDKTNRALHPLLTSAEKYTKGTPQSRQRNVLKCSRSPDSGFA